MQKWMEKPVIELKNAVSAFVENKIDVNELKKVTAGFGIYPQRNNLFMLRIRITGGELKIKQLSSIYALLKQFNIPFIRVTTRQDIQLHNVLPETINDIIDFLICDGFIFRGGGGDTFRNITISYDSGISKQSIFDVMPYAEAVTECVYKIDNAYSLPRKIKIAFSSDNTDKAFAKWSDLGFIAVKNEEGEFGFEVYMAGGMGRKSIKAFKAFNFIPAKECEKFAIAMINLFDKHGNRNNRSKARIRFLRREIGTEEFLNLFNRYYSEVDESYQINNIVVKNYTAGKSPVDATAVANKDFILWENTFCEESIITGCSIVRIPIKSGNINHEDLGFILDVLNMFSIEFIRLNRVHEIICLVADTALPAFYKKLSEAESRNFTRIGFAGHITSCVGAAICPLGLVDSQKFAAEIGLILDDVSDEITSENYNKLISNIAVSGCGNSCTNPEAFGIAVTGRKVKVNGEMQEGCNIRIKSGFIGNKDEMIIESSFDDLKQNIAALFN